ncbi:MAG: AraC family transcriptional regulator [Pseudomonadota bacterium]
MTLADKVIWHLEMSLGDPLTIDQLADLSGVSRFHMMRVFALTTGTSPLAYLRARRLSKAAISLARGNEDILTIALSASYGSHEAFTRAFASYFQTLPSTVRRIGNVDGLELMEPLQMKTDMLINLDAPIIQDVAQMKIIGPVIECTFEDTSQIPSLWESFNRQVDPSDLPNARAFGVCFEADQQGKFRYMAGVEAYQNSAVLEGAETADVPSGKYAIFTHRGHVADLPKATYTIWNKSLPDASLEPRSAPELEVYDARFDPTTGRGEIEIWVPVN